MTGCKVSIGGSGLNTASSCRFAMDQIEYPTKGVTYFGCIGSDENGDELEDHLKKGNLLPQLYRTGEAVTGASAAVVVNGERTLCADIGASTKYPMSHLDTNFDSVKASKYVYAAGYFLTSNAEALLKIGAYCAEVNKPFVFNLAAGFIIQFNYDEVL